MRTFPFWDFVSSFWVTPFPSSLQQPWNALSPTPNPHALHFYCHTDKLYCSFVFSSQCKCKYIISQHEAKPHFRTLIMPFQNQRPGDSQAMIFIIALLHCGEYNSAIYRSGCRRPTQTEKLVIQHHSQKCWRVSVSWKCSSICPSSEWEMVWNLENVHGLQIIFATFF